MSQYLGHSSTLLTAVLVSIMSFYPNTAMPESCSIRERSETAECALEASEKQAVVAVIGVGYVGEHLVQVFSSAFSIVGYDVQASRVESLRSKYLHLDNVKFSNDERDLKDASHFLICVPTSLGLSGQVDSSHIRIALRMLNRYVTDRSIVVIESTVAIGMTRDFLGPMAKSHGVFAGMSPEVGEYSNQIYS